MGGCQNHGPFLGTLNIRCRIIVGIRKGTLILTTIQFLHKSSSTAHGNPWVNLTKSRPKIPTLRSFTCEELPRGHVGSLCSNRVYLGSYRDNGKENGNYYTIIGLI